MRKTILVLALMIGVCGAAYAEDMQDSGGEQRPMPGRMGGKMMGMMGMMGGGRSVTATSDGGVVVMEGHRLIKYDKDLTLVKEVELPKGKGPGKQTEGEEPPPPPTE